MRTLIRGGALVDGSGQAARRADVLIEGEKIAAVAPEISPERADEVIGASGKVVCPGFVDIHRHHDRRMLAGWNGLIELRQGITTAIAGNCGISLAPANPEWAQEQYAFAEPVLGTSCANPPVRFPDYMEALSRAALPINAGAMIGTGAIRASLRGFSGGRLSAQELSAARDRVDEALSAGAVGVSMGIMYVPECYNQPEDYAAMLAPLGRRGGTLTAHIRGEGDSLVESVREAIAIAETVGCALEISHFKSCGLLNWRREIHRAIAEVEAARARGLDAAVDFYPYDGGSTALTTMIPPAFLAGDMKRAIARLGTPPGADEFRASVSQTHPNWDNFALSLGWDRIVVSGVSSPENARFVGMTVQAAAEKFGFPDAAACAAHIMHTDSGKTAIINMSMCGDDIDTVARLPYASVISDALYADAASPHPRLYGAFPKVLREFVRERGVLTLEGAIQKMTALPAARMGIAGRGLVREGYFADVLVFDPEAFRDRADYAHPARLAEGLHRAIINGKTALMGDELAQSGCGALLRRNAQ